MKALKYILYGLVIAAAGGLLAYQAFVEKNLESSNVTRCILIIAAAILGMVKPRKNRRIVSNKKVAYGKAYAEHIQNAFTDDPKLEAKFYNAVHDYNRQKPAAAIAKLEKLRKDCQRSADLRAVTVFTALCYDDMGLYEESVKHYEAAIAIRPNSSLCSNLGLAYYRLGDEASAEKAYLQAIQLDPRNAYAHNNYATLLFRRDAYGESLRCAEEAIAINATFKQALSTAALCCALMNDKEGYQNYYRRAVANGYDGNKIKSVLDMMGVEL
jgi:tetratricopeptide (TPR) repeat protein